MMDQLISLRNSEINTSVSSKLGYETAQDDSSSSMYYSILDDTPTNISSTLPNQSGLAETTIDSDTVTSKGTNSNEDSSSAISSTLVSTNQPIEPIIQPMEPTIQPMKPTIQSMEPIIQPMEPIIQPMEPTIQPMKPTIQPMEPTIQPMESTNHPCQTIDPFSASDLSKNCLDPVSQIPSNDLRAVATASNVIFTSTTTLSSSSSTNFRDGSRVVQEFCPAAVSQQQTYKAPQRAARRSAMPRPPILPSSRRTVVGTNANANVMPRRTLRPLVENNTETRPEAHICDICKKSFPLRLTLNVHKNAHTTECKYCDRKFKKPLALSTHLKEHCQKIPSAVRRKILTNEFKNVSSRM